MGSREESLKAIRRVKLPTAEPSRYRLRKETKPGGLATIEAMARALGVLESPEVEEALERIFALMVERTLRKSRREARRAGGAGSAHVRIPGVEAALDVPEAPTRAGREALASAGVATTSAGLALSATSEISSMESCSSLIFWWRVT